MTNRTAPAGRLIAGVFWAACAAVVAGNTLLEGIGNLAVQSTPAVDCADAPSDKDRDAVDAARDKILHIDHRPDDGAFATLTALLDSARGGRYAAFRANVQAVLAIDNDVHVIARLNFAQQARKTLTDLHCDASDALSAEADAYRDIGAAKDAARVYAAAAASIKDPDLRQVRMHHQSEAAEALINIGNFDGARQQYEVAQAEAVAAKELEDEATIRGELLKLKGNLARASAVPGPRRVVNYNASTEITDAALCRGKNVVATLGEGRQTAPVLNVAGGALTENITTLQLWDLESNAPLWNLPSPEDHVLFSPDCSLLASVGHETSIVDTASGRALKTFPAPGPVDFSPDGRSIWIGVAVFDLTSASTTWLMPAPKDPRAEESILAVNFASDIYLVSPKNELGRVEVRHRNSSAVQPVDMSDGSPATAAAISDGGSVALLGTQKGGLCFLFIDSFKLQCLEFATSPIKSVTVSRHGRTFAVRDEKGVHLMDFDHMDAERKTERYEGAMAAVSTKEDGIGLWQKWHANDPLHVIDFHANQTQSLSGSGGEIDTLTFAPNSRELIFAGNGALYALDFDRGRVRPYDLSETQLRYETFSHMGTSSDGQTVFASASESPELLVFNRATGRATVVQSPHRTSMSGFQIVPRVGGSDFILSTDGNGAALLWNPLDGTVAKHYAADNGRVTKLSISGDGSRILTAGEDGALRLFDVAEGRSRVLKHYPESMESIAVSSDGRYAAACSDDHVDIWDLASAADPSSHPVRCSTGLSFVHDSTLVVVASGHITALNTGSDRQVEIASTGLDSSVFGVAETAGKVMYRIGGRDGGVFLADVADLWTTPAAPISRARIAPIQGSHRRLSISSDAQFVLVADDDGRLREYNVVTGTSVCEFVNRNVNVERATISGPGTELIAPLKNGYVAFWEAKSCKASRVLKHPEKIAAMDLSSDGTRLTTASADGNTRLFNAATTDPIVRVPGHDTKVAKAITSPGGKYVVTMGTRGDVRVWNLETAVQLRSLPVHISSPDAVDPELVFVSETRLAVHEAGVPEMGAFILDRPDPKQDYPSHVGIWDVETGEEVGALPAESHGLYLFADPTEAETVLSMDETGPLLTSWNYHRRTPDFQQDVGTATRPAQSNDGKLFAFHLADGSIEVWDHAKRQELFSIVLADGNRWTVFTPDGRFETASFDQSTLVSWVLPSNPFRALPMEFFTADYFEGGLVPRVMRGTLAPVRPPAARSLARPEVTVDSVKSTGPSEVSVTVKVARAAVAPGAAPRERAPWPAVEVRLFRDGQLVAISDESSPGRSELAAGTTVKLPFPGVQVPAKADGTPVVFTVYAFSPDGVRSDVSVPLEFKQDAAVTPEPRRAYVVAVGVNASANPARDLRFAANDARDVADELRGRLKGAANVVAVTLTSERGPAPPTATKAHLEQVFRCLAAGVCDSALLREIPSGSDLRRARPEDFVIVFMASHGYRDSDDRFYLFPYDVSEEAAAAPTAAVLRSAISGEMLRRWLLPVDSGHIMLILDTCDSQSVVDAQGFKPAPLLSRTFGQLAFDKGMKVLSATKTTESDDPALKHGWLTNRLLVTGLTGAAADFDPRDGALSLTEWLRYGEGGNEAAVQSALNKEQHEPFLFDFGNWRVDLNLAIGRIR